MMLIWYTLAVLSHLAVCWLVWEHFRSPLTFGRWQQCWSWMAGAMIARFGLLVGFFWHPPTPVEVVSHLGISTGLFMSLWTLRQILLVRLEPRLPDYLAHLTIDQFSQIVDWDAGAMRLFGWTRAEAVGLTLMQTVMMPRDWEAHRAGMARYLAKERGIRTLRRTYAANALRKDGSEVSIEVTISAMPQADGTHYFAAQIRELVPL